MSDLITQSEESLVAKENARLRDEQFMQNIQGQSILGEIEEDKKKNLLEIMLGSILGQ